MMELMKMTKKIRFMETVLRDGHQSLVATRMSTPGNAADPEKNGRSRL